MSNVPHRIRIHDVPCMAEVDARLRERLPADCEDDDDETYTSELRKQLPNHLGVVAVAYRRARRARFDERDLDEKKEVFMHFLTWAGREVVRVPFEEHLPQEQVQEIRTRIVAAVRDVVDAARCDADLDKVISSNFFVKIGERHSSAAASATFGEHAKQLRNLASFEVERVIAAAKEMSGRGVPVDQMCDALMPSARPHKKQKQRVA